MYAWVPAAARLTEAGKPAPQVAVAVGVGVTVKVEGATAFAWARGAAPLATFIVTVTDAAAATVVTPGEPVLAAVKLPKVNAAGLTALTPVRVAESVH